ncbi:PAS/PAC sensor hybrid histidine kinase [Mariprofundus ferrinatatus]|uniref:histidine kinase n=1 Tax=Mariprofundus ferrinatatus TaxID=1921087 RepID=A0A2K8L5V8_9PROT|nr:PAS domain S-box protein [Mariprofundus ferrinatatus]ATX82710.1 PAS/PAC sensor hybrid histidine kinase [Mariprofundus ferrinatatus]
MQEHIIPVKLDSISELNSLLFEVMNDGALIVDHLGIILDCNPCFHSRLGYSKDEVVGLSVTELDPPEFAIKVPSRLQQIREKGSTVFETAHYRKDGSIMPVEMNARFIDIGGKTVFFSIVRDISERKQHEKALLAKEQELESLFQHASDGIFIADLNGCYTAVNSTGCTMLGYQKDELIGKSISDLLPPKEQERLAAHKKKLLQGESEVSEWYLQKKDGHLFPVEVSARILNDGRWLAFVRDISERKRMDVALQEKERKYNALVETSTDGFWVADSQGRFIEVNDAYLERSGYTRDEFLQLRIPDIEASETSEDTKAHIEKIIREGHDRFETWHRSRNGTIWPVEVVTTFYPYNGGMFMVFCVDISERKRAQQEIAAHQKELAKLSQALQHAGEGVLITDQDGNIEYANKAFTLITGYSPDEVVGQSTSILKSETQDPSVYRDLWRTITSGKTWEGNLIDRRKDGSLFPAMLSIAPIFDEVKGISHYVSIIKDLTEFKRMEQQLLQAQKMESIGTLVGGIAHDFNNMLAAVQGNVFLAIRNLNNPDTVKEKLQSIHSLGTRAGNIVKQLLTFAKKDIVDLEVIELNSAIHDAYKLARSVIPENITQNIELCDERLNINADATQLQQVMINLSSNARDAVENCEHPVIEWRMEKYQATPAFKKLHPENDKEEFARVSVTDNGYGIKEAHLNAIFDPFFTTKEPGKGTGLGLAMVIGSIERLGGVVEVETKQGEGSAFNIYLPLVHSPVIQVEEAAVTPASGNMETILLADDEESLRTTTSEVLQGLGYTVIEARDGEEALSLYHKHQKEVALLLSDIVMPGIGGVELAQRLRRMDSKLPIILATGYDKELVTSGQAAIEGCEILTKPYSFEMLSTLIRRLIVKA